MWTSLYIAGTIGSEGGIVLADEEYKQACRITLEKCEKYYAITCGIYGAMAHTAFAGEEDHQAKYDAMKAELRDFIDRDTTSDEELRFYEDFCNKY